ncbi:hypothetical protein GCM10009727_89470 [Actinomadura napierensis]|uniref:Transposase n=1 Tax=Actinomadura napierensis TaxID=267854 RepID=A0ABN3AGW4_9ACTN
MDGPVVWAYAGGMARYPQGGGMSAVGRERREQVWMQAAQWFGEERPNAWIAAELRAGLRQVEKGWAVVGGSPGSMTWTPTQRTDKRTDNRSPLLQCMVLREDAACRVRRVGITRFARGLVARSTGVAVSRAAGAERGGRLGAQGRRSACRGAAAAAPCLAG